MLRRISEKISLNNATSKNILLLAILRGGNIFIQLLLVPISIRYVSSEYYGLWLTISSMITWLNIMDFGLSNGLRNKLSETKISGDTELGKVYISTTYGILSLIAVCGIIFFGTISYYTNWAGILDIPEKLPQSSLFQLLFIVIFSFFITFLLKPISAIAYSFHQPYIDPLINFCAAVVNLVAVLVLSHFDSSGNILYLALVFCLTPILVNLILTLLLFSTKFKDYRPSGGSIDLKYAKPLMSLSGKFFIIQIAATLVLTTTNFIISHYFGNRAVTEFNIVQRYFSVVLILQSMILVPFWNLITEAYNRKEKDWLTKTMERLSLTNLAFSGLVILMTVASPYILKLWISDTVEISFSLTLLFAIYTIIFLYSSLYTTFINGTGKVKLQMTTSVFTCIFYIPFVILLVKFFSIGVAGIVIASALWALVLVPVRYIQYKNLLNFDDKVSIWNT
ncbi:lipopolysaccharide biosynthesis protein [Dyadobacter sp. CY356]|uniref:lipopolysaccharide biosynthesis protein n=1 Tax=Dyadobacter sp. CY356 TaxID=2906442 RepID=UPI001F22590E|nr:oligosaccharide flippase family protein [Dyadobacter sp. CY356]MCF0055164.1 oligosaccharide flippase family protein [Dyadobacter sp. CY356]